MIGSNGLLPTDLYLERIRSHYGGNASSYLTLLDAAPTFFWWVPNEHLDLALDVSAYVGLTLSVFIILLGAGNTFVFGALWILYHSLTNIGQRWLDLKLLIIFFQVINFLILYSLAGIHLVRKNNAVHCSIAYSML